MIQLSIVVAVYNTEKYLGRCLDSLLRQQLLPENYEIIVINDGSPGNCGEIVHNYMLKYSQIRYFEQTNQGLFETRNIGTNLATGRYIYYIDSDDFLAPNALGTIIAFMDEKKLDFFGFDLLETTESTISPPAITRADLEGAIIHKGLDYLSRFDYRKESVWFVVKRSLLSKHNIDYHKGIGFSDGLFSTESLFHARRMAFIPHKLYAYYQHSESILNKVSSEHYRHLLRRYEVSSEEFTKVREKIENDPDMPGAVISRVRSKEMSYIFYMLLRVVKSDLSFQEIGETLQRLKLKEYYPIKGFLLPDNSTIVNRLLLLVLNHRFMFYPAIFLYRKLAPIIKYFR